MSSPSLSARDSTPAQSSQQENTASNKTTDQTKVCARVQQPILLNKN